MAEIGAWTQPTSQTVREMAREVHDTAKEKGWWPTDDPRSIGELIALCHSELSEGLEEYRNGNDPLYFKDDKPEGMLIELADCVIRVFDMCEFFGWNIERALQIKIAYNKGRDFRHGGKVI